MNFKLSGNSFSPQANRLYEFTNIVNLSDKNRIISAGAGALLYGLSFAKKKNWLGTSLRYSGLYLLYRGLSGNCPISAALNKNEIERHTKTTNFRTSIIINAPVETVYGMWENLEKMPKYLKHIKKIKTDDELRSSWVLQTPGSMPNIEWKAEIIEQRKNEEISWRTLPGSMIEAVGKLNFISEGNATRLIILISYRPPAGYIGSFISSVLKTQIKNYIKEDILSLKKQAEKLS